MTASQISFQPGAFTAPVVDYEPPPSAVGAAPCPTPSPTALHRSPRRRPRPVDRLPADVLPPPTVAGFADAALRRVLEVIDRRRPIAALRPMLTPPLLDMVYTLARTPGTDKAAVLRRVRLRTAAVDDAEPHQPTAVELFASYTRGQRVRAIAGRIEVNQGRWHVVALQIG